MPSNKMSLFKKTSSRLHKPRPYASLSSSSTNNGSKLSKAWSKCTKAFRSAPKFDTQPVDTSDARTIFCPKYRECDELSLVSSSHLPADAPKTNNLSVALDASIGAEDKYTPPLFLPQAVEIANTQSCLFQSPYSSAWNISSTNIDLESQNAALKDALATKKREASALALRVVDLKVDINKQSSQIATLQTESRERAAENISNVSKLSSQAIDATNDCLKLQKEKKAMLTAHHHELADLQRKLDQAHDYNDNLDRMDKDRIMRGAAQDKTLAEEYFQRLTAMNYERRGPMPNSIDTEKLIESKNAAYNRLEQRRADEVSELEQKLHNVKQENSEVHEAYKAALKASAVAETKSEMLLSRLAQMTASVEVSIRQLHNNKHDPKVVLECRGLLKKLHRDNKLLQKSLETIRNEQASETDELLMTKRKAGKLMEMLYNLEKQHKELEKDNSQKDINLMSLEVEVEVIKLQAEKTYFAKKAEIAALKADKEALKDGVVQLGKMSQSTHQLVALRKFEFDIDVLKTRNTDLEKYADRLEEFEHCRRYNQKLDNMCGFFMEDALAEERVTNRCLQAILVKHGIDPFDRTHDEMIPVEEPGTSHGGTPARGLQLNHKSLGSIASPNGGADKSSTGVDSMRSVDFELWKEEAGAEQEKEDSSKAPHLSSNEGSSAGSWGKSVIAHVQDSVASSSAKRQLRHKKGTLGSCF